MLRRALAAAGLILIVLVSVTWIRDRIAERCPDVGPATTLNASVTERSAWRFAEVVVGTRHYTVSPSVNASYWPGVGLPLPQSHPVSVGLTIQADDEPTVQAWRSSCIRVTYRGDSMSRPATTGRDVITSGDRSFRYRFDGARGYPEWPPQEMVDLEITVVVDGSAFLIRIPSVPIVPMG